MKRMIRAALALLVAVCAMGALTACGGDYAGKQDVANVQSAVDELNGTLAQLKSEVDALKGAGDSGLAGRVQQLETKLTAAQEALTAVQETLNELDGAPESITALNTAVKEIQASLGTLNTGVDDLDAALTTVNEALAAMREQLDALSGKTENDGSKVKAIGEATNVYSNGLLIFTITPYSVEAQSNPQHTYIHFRLTSTIGLQITSTELLAYVYNQSITKEARSSASNAFDFMYITVSEITSYQLYITYNKIPVAHYDLSLPYIA